jgi:hypothetical protein
LLLSLRDIDERKFSWDVDMTARGNTVIAGARLARVIWIDLKEELGAVAEAGGAR